MRAILCALLVAGVAASAARADGLPVLGIDVGAKGVTVPGARYRYVTAAVGVDTIVARVERGNGRVRRSRILRGSLTIPAVAYDGSAAGLSADRASLVLIAPRDRFPRARTLLTVVGTRDLRVRRRIVLRGDFSFDAISPTGQWVYLIHYTSPADPLRYQLRVLDAVTGSLMPRPIVGPRELDESMGGRPLTRTASPDGRWAFTLYERPGAAPFVHALDTTGRTARCIDLDWLRAPRQLVGVRLVLRDGGQVDVVSRGVTRAVIDTHSWIAARPNR